MPRKMRIAVELELEGESIRGSAAVEGNAPRSFSGWIGLVGALDALSKNHQQQGAEMSTETKSPIRTIDDGAGSRLHWMGVVSDPEHGDVLRVRNEVAPGHGPPMHTHFHQTEELTVESGTIAWQIAGEATEHRAGPGETVRFEPGVSHRFWNAGNDELVCEGGIWPPDNIQYFLSNVYESTRRSGGKRPTAFDGAFLTTHFRDEFRMDEIPAVASKVIIPIVYRIGRLFGRYERFADAPEPVRG